MGNSVPERIIRLLCGDSFYKQGLSYYQSGWVELSEAYDIELEDSYGENYITSQYSAIVQGEGENYQLEAYIRSDNDVDAECTCPDFQASASGRYCEHIAAMLIAILNQEQKEGRKGAGRVPQGPAPHSTSSASPRAADGHSRDQQIVNSMLGLFERSKVRPGSTGRFVDLRTPLRLEIICKPYQYRHGGSMLGVELKVGPGRMYIVQQARVFLEHVQRGEPYTFSRHFSYDPALHSFGREDHAILLKLIEAWQQEQLYRDGISSYASTRADQGGDRLLPVPPLLWNSLAPLLIAAPSVYLQQGHLLVETLQFSDDIPPLRFGFEPDGEGYRLQIEGLEQLTVLQDYGLVLSEGRLLKVAEAGCRQLAEMNVLLGSSRRNGIGISPEQMEPFMDKVIPGLQKLGQVQIADSIASRIVQTQLSARLYLDRVKDRLLAGLEFQYGDIILNPLEEQARGTKVILIRDTEAERRILELMEQGSFAATESGYMLHEEEAEYDFLYHTVPLLEELLEIYATSAVKARLVTGASTPKASLSWNEKTDWLDFKFDMAGIPETEIVQILHSLQDKRKYYRLPNGALLPLESAEFQEIISFMNELGLHQVDLQSATMSLPVLHGLNLKSPYDKSDAVKIGKSFRQLLADMQNPDHLDFPVPESLIPVLRDYQQHGFQWLKTLAHYRFGGILADDMGLGKTLQSIAFLLSELDSIRESGQPALIVAPASLVYNWLNELKKFTPQLRAVIADGNLTERSRILQSPAGADVIITSYPLLRRDVKLYKGRSFHTLILDEAQTIKNHATQTAQAVQVLQARHRFALTGTPVENTLEDLWSIFSTVLPGLFPGKKAFHDLPRETVAQRARPFLLRRLKRDVLKELPDKIESLQASELLPEQKKLYVAYLAQLQKEALKHLNKDSFFGQSRIKILAGLTRLRQLCCHPALFVEGYTGGSAKFEQLLEIIEECRSSGKRMLVFSQFTEMLGLIGRELGVQGVPYFYLDGQTPASQRVELCDRFNQGNRDLFLISLKAGGTGLNLTGADTVILYDLWWNPAVEQQAADRAHRMGQKNVVQVIRLVAQGTVEDKMYELQQKKKNLIDEVIQPGQEGLSTLTEQDIRSLLLL
ncbi:DEAD/DEAH box helicase [Paenibacillus donghaensis]|uniref:DEAD/DEAH box helicase n=1 Tax=Paenibacillus donghaensis TaxID=414771 RepID=UPI001FE2925F|nr:DEAD/DEAH box helicase [Paenibacillus donghaensis]